MSTFEYQLEDLESLGPQKIMSFTKAISANANVYILASALNQNLSHTLRIIPYAESYSLQTRIGVDPIQQIQRAYEDEMSLRKD